jgi:hypothetical protein
MATQETDKVPPPLRIWIGPGTALANSRWLLDAVRGLEASTLSLLESSHHAVGGPNSHMGRSLVGEN